MRFWATGKIQEYEDRLRDAVEQACDDTGWDLMGVSTTAPDGAVLRDVSFYRGLRGDSSSPGVQLGVTVETSSFDHLELSVVLTEPNTSVDIRNGGDRPAGTAPVAYEDLPNVLRAWLQTAEPMNITPVGRLKRDIEAAAGALFRLVEYIDGVAASDVDLNRLLRQVEAERAQLDDIAKALRRELHKHGGPNHRVAKLLAGAGIAGSLTLTTIFGWAEGVEAMASLRDRFRGSADVASVARDAQDRCQQVIETINIIHAGADSVVVTDSMRMSEVLNDSAHSTVDGSDTHVRVTPATVDVPATVHDPTIRVDTPSGPDEPPGPAHRTP